MHNIKLNIDKTLDFISREQIFSFQEEMINHHQALINKTGKGNDFLGWVDLPDTLDPAIIENIEAEAKRRRGIADLFVGIGIGGSYLGDRAVIEALSSPFSHLNIEAKEPQIIYAGHHIGEDYMAELL